MLHSYKTQFSDIETGELKTVEIDIPDDMKSILSEE